MSPKVMSGARAKLGVFDPSTGQTQVVGIFSNVSYGLTYDTSPIYILGRYSAAEIEYTSMDVVHIQASGWRVIKQGPHVAARIPKLSDLLNHEYLELAIIDRQLEATGADGRIAKFRQVRPTGYSTSISARQPTDVQVNFTGILVDDESTTNNEHVGSTDLP
jgi:hypothetical protein